MSCNEWEVSRDGTRGLVAAKGEVEWESGLSGLRSPTAHHLFLLSSLPFPFWSLWRSRSECDLSRSLSRPPCSLLLSSSSLAPGLLWLGVLPPLCDLEPLSPRLCSAMVYLLRLLRLVGVRAPRTTGGSRANTQPGVDGASKRRAVQRSPARITLCSRKLSTDPYRRLSSPRGAATSSDSPTAIASTPELRDPRSRRALA